jgi:hypothetical protein
MFNSDRHGILRGELSQRLFMRIAEFLHSKV